MHESSRMEIPRGTYCFKTRRKADMKSLGFGNEWPQQRSVETTWKREGILRLQHEYYIGEVVRLFKVKLTSKKTFFPVYLTFCTVIKDVGEFESLNLQARFHTN